MASYGKVRDGDVVKLSSDDLVMFLDWRVVFFFQDDADVFIVDGAVFQIEPEEYVFGKYEFQDFLFRFHIMKIVKRLTTFMILHLRYGNHRLRMTQQMCYKTFASRKNSLQKKTAKARIHYKKYMLSWKKIYTCNKFFPAYKSANV